MGAQGQGQRGGGGVELSVGGKRLGKLEGVGEALLGKGGFKMDGGHMEESPRDDDRKRAILRTAGESPKETRQGKHQWRVARGTWRRRTKSPHDGTRKMPVLPLTGREGLPISSNGYPS